MMGEDVLLLLGMAKRHSEKSVAQCSCYATTVTHCVSRKISKHKCPLQVEIFAEGLKFQQWFAV